MNPGPGLAIALVLLVAVAVVASLAGRVRLERQIVIASLRAVGQLAVVSLVITAAVQHLAGAAAFVLLMFVVAVVTTTGRVDARRAWPWTVLAMLAGVVPVLGIVFASGAAPLNGITLISLAGIVIGNMMTAHTLAGRRCFAELRSNIPTYEAALSLGLPRSDAIGEVIQPVVAESLIPNLDQTRTVGLVTLPGAFIGVLLGGGSPLQAGAAQVLVLLGIMAGQGVTVTVAALLMRSGRLLPADLAARLRP